MSRTVERMASMEEGGRTKARIEERIGSRKEGRKEDRVDN